MVRDYTEASYGARTWRRQRRVAARIEATAKGLDIRYVVTNIAGGSAEWLYDKSPAYAGLSAVATAGNLPTAPTPPMGTRPLQAVIWAFESTIYAA